MQTLFVGNARHPDFAAVRLDLPTVVECESPADALRSAEIGSCELLVLAQSYRQQFCPRAAERLRQANPQAAPVNVLSSLCEGEVRSGRPLLGWNRVLWYRWPAEYARFCSGDRTVWSPEPLAQANDRFLQRARGSGGGVCCQVGLIGRNAPRLATLGDVLGQMGHQVQVVDPPHLTNAIAASSIDVVLVAGDSLDRWLRQTVEQVRRFRRLQRIVVLLNFPRASEVDWLRRKCGARVAVVAQPFELFELQYALRGQLGVVDSACERSNGQISRPDRRTA